jgi:hypothetical protein
MYYTLLRAAAIVGYEEQTSHNIKIITTHIKNMTDKSAQCSGFLKTCCLRMAL